MDEATGPFQRDQETMGQDEIREFILSELADIRMTDQNTLTQQIIAQGGDLEMKSDEACSITGSLEGKLGRELVGPEALDPTHLTSVNRLSAILHESMHQPPKKTTGKQQRGQEKKGDDQNH